jgi:hypothetical protein
MKESDTEILLIVAGLAWLFFVYIPQSVKGVTLPPMSQ